MVLYPSLSFQIDGVVIDHLQGCQVGEFDRGRNTAPCAVHIGATPNIGKSDRAALGFRNAQRGSNGRPGSFWIAGGPFEVGNKAISPWVTFQRHLRLRRDGRQTSGEQQLREIPIRAGGRDTCLPASRKRTMPLRSDRNPSHGPLLRRLSKHFDRV